MITAARPNTSGPCHYYQSDGKPVWSVPNKSKPGESRPTTLSDCRKLKLLPSPTTILKLLHRHALVEWQIEQAILATATTPRNEGEELDAFIERVLHKDRVQDEERNAAADKGKRIHKALQNYLTSAAEISGEMSEYVNPVVRAIEQLGRVVATEKVLVGDGYAGMTDCIVHGNDLWIADFKTCRRIPDYPYDEQKLQVAAYCGALGNVGENRIRGALIHISTTEPGNIKVTEVTDWQRDHKRFMMLLNFWKLTNEL